MSGAAVLLTVGTFAAAPAEAWGSGGGGGGGGGSQSTLVPVFEVSPSTTQVNTAVTPTVTVKVENPSGQVDWNYNGPVVLKYAVNRLGAPLPSGNQVDAVDGVASFPDLTFSAVGFGFELLAEIPGQQQSSQWPQPWPQPWAQPWWQGWNWLPDSGQVSEASSAFDIVGQLLQCESEGTCQSQTVSSDGTSGSSIANTSQGSGELTATGGGFSDLSCTTAGGVVSFYSNLSQTITITLAPSVIDHQWLSQWLKSVSVCFGSSEPFTTKSGVPAVYNSANGDYEGVLPNCRWWRSAPPCVKSRSGGWGQPVTITILAPAGDPHITYG
ncbi:MAG TPA: hypothetical protein VME19_04115 [Streptosporangiaceae bacterium]|nr:hypothetical protein [Streptosporangiaceae bacterium]